MLPYNLRCPASVLIEDGRLGFKISMMEEPNPVTGEWIESHLGLVSVSQQGNSNYLPKKVRSDICSHQEELGHRNSAKRCQAKAYRQMVFQYKKVGAQRKEKVFHQKRGDLDKRTDRSNQINQSNHNSWKVVISPKMAKEVAYRAEVERWVGNESKLDPIEVEVRPSSKSNSLSSEDESIPLIQMKGSDKACGNSPTNLVLLDQVAGEDFCVYANSMFKGGYRPKVSQFGSLEGRVFES
ncbi:hypothetical protein LWI28_000095 [Acer negundo]|uniref:Uncharacterized protein n=1 Tax=Acer negundo TaxID=4023 RepID=A0AAD5NW20_ACENE|nr:hypothetical protein LWI28_000095 [Acer negundo]KAK4852074.1 hypothetical protein QYF36_020903 [Acer negundo]